MKVIQPRPLNVRKMLLVGLVILGLVIWNSVRRPPPPKHPSWTGRTMGTTYTVSLADSPLKWNELRALHEDVETYLIHVNDLMSTYLPTSEISRFNASRTTEPVKVSDALATVTRFALKVSEESQGAFDPTVGPLVNLWGFGPEGDEGPPAEEALEAVRRMCGHRNLTVPSDTSLQKRISELQLDLNAVAKGYAVDHVADLALRTGAQNVFVEIGGECMAHGHNSGGGPWRIGIDVPSYGALPGEGLQEVVNLSGMAIATSGDYRNFHTNETGSVYAHIIDPRTGKPVAHQLASVSVLAGSCMKADALATALFVMGPVEGLRWIEAYPNAEALFVSREEDGSFRERASPGFEAFLGTDNP